MSFSRRLALLLALGLAAATAALAQSSNSSSNPADSASDAGQTLAQAEQPATQFQSQEQFPIGIERPGVGLVQILILRNSPDLRGGRHAVNPAASLIDPLVQPLLVDGQPRGFDECPNRARCIRVGQ